MGIDLRFQCLPFGPLLHFHIVKRLCMLPCNRLLCLCDSMQHLIVGVCQLPDLIAALYRDILPALSILHLRDGFSDQMNRL